MEWIAEVLSALGAIVLSLACGLLVEEMVFGILSRFFFAPQAATVRRTNQGRN
jgi:hypothetical protein